MGATTLVDQLRTSDANEQPWALGSLARQRQAQSERRALSQLRARSQGPAVESAQRSRDVKAQAMPAAVGGIGAVESIEDGLCCATVAHEKRYRAKSFVIEHACASVVLRETRASKRGGRHSEGRRKAAPLISSTCRR